MAGHTRDFSDTKLPDILTGVPCLGGYRFSLVYHSTAVPAIGDDIYLYFRVPTLEYWRIRAFEVSEYTSGAGAGGNGWQRQLLRCSGPRDQSPEANAGATKPPGLWTRTATWAWTSIFQRDWDGATYLSWLDANGAPLIVRDSDPGVGPLVIPPDSAVALNSYGAEAAAVGAQAFDLRMIVDRILAADIPQDLALALALRAED